MDEIYRFRSGDRLLGNRAELVSQTIYFAESSELNDPMEPIRGFEWRGDTIAWTNLFRHYVNCLHHIYLLLRLSEPNQRVGGLASGSGDPDGRSCPNRRSGGCVAVPAAVVLATERLGSMLSLSRPPDWPVLVGWTGER